MAFRYIVSSVPIIGGMLALVLLVAVACGGAEAPAPDAFRSGPNCRHRRFHRNPGPSGSRVGASRSDRPCHVGASRSVRPCHVRPFNRWDGSRPRSADATPTPVAAALPTEVLANPITLDNLMVIYPDVVYGRILRRGGYYDPAHFDLLQVSSVTNSFKQMMVYNNILRYNPIDAGKTIIPDLAYQLGSFGGRKHLDVPHT